jgi:hypothetical protein
MLTGYFDDSSAHSDKLLCVSGYVSTRDDWAAFSDLWQQRLDKAGLKVFRMKEHANKRDSAPLIRDLIDLTLDAMQFGVGVSICPKEYNSLTSTRFSPYFRFEHLQITS